MNQIFVSYSHRDKTYAHKLHRHLLEQGFNAWIDDRMDYGSRWPNEIEKRLKECAIFILIMSPNSYESEWVQNELSFAKKLKKHIFPLLLDGDVWLQLHTTQFVDVKGGKLPPTRFFVHLAEVLSYNQSDHLPEKGPDKGDAKSDTITDINIGKDIAGSVIIAGNNNVVHLDRGQKILKRNKKGEEGARKTWAVKIPTNVYIFLLRITSILGIIILLIWGGLWVIPKISSFIQSAISSPTVAAGSTLIPLPTEITQKGTSMVLVPAGDFIMGSNITNDTKPVTKIRLGTFYIDKYEVTNALYRVCVNLGKCISPKQVRSETRSNYYGNSDFDNFPVIYVSWDMARTYCEWRGARLPTEAEWEKAARGPGLRTYPWGDQVNCNNANYAMCIGDTASVESYPDGKSFYGAYNMGGNVSEWVSSLYISYPYKSDYSHEDPTITSNRVFRGGSFNDAASSISVFHRNQISPNYVFYSIGFRCADTSN